jgi:hypothetical protein
MNESKEYSGFNLGLTINDFLSLEGFPIVSSIEEQSIRMVRNLHQVEYHLCYAMAYRIWEKKQNETQK